MDGDGLGHLAKHHVASRLMFLTAHEDIDVSIFVDDPNRVARFESNRRVAIPGFTSFGNAAPTTVFSIFGGFANAVGVQRRCRANQVSPTAQIVKISPLGVRPVQVAQGQG